MYYQIRVYTLRIHLFVILTAIGWFVVNIPSDLFWHRCLERQALCTPRMYTLSPSKSIKGSNYGEFHLSELQISCVFAFFTLWKRVKTHVLSDQSVHIMHTHCCVSKLSKFGAYVYAVKHSDLIIHAFLLVFIV
jgi:hypothetical protein